MRALSEADVAIGGKLREARLRRGMTQATLADHLGVTFQQVQKYENGKNRIAAGKLSIAARVLEVPHLFFFEEHEASTLRPLSRETLEAVQLIDNLPPEVRSRVVAMLRAIHGAGPKP